MKDWPKTQKARGLLELLTGLRNHRWMALPPQRLMIGPSSKEAMGDEASKPPGYHHGSSIAFPCFARPCPTTPRHGFVESRSVYNILGALNILAETLHADPNGEVIFMPRCSGKYSAVANNAGIVWGHGNAGVTSGDGGGQSTAFIPCLIGSRLWTNTVCRPSAAGVTECAYIELVEDKGSVRLVQLRDGPAQSGACGDFVPAPVTVTAVVAPGQVGFDLIRWDRLIRGAAPGTVAVLPASSTRFSHFAVHCLINKVPIVFRGGDRPELGASLAPTSTSPPTRLTREDYEYIARIIMQRLLQRERIEDIVWGDAAHPQSGNIHTWQVATSIGVCHAMQEWGADPHLLRLRGEGVAACFRYSATACIGEVRHFYSNGPGRCDAQHVTDMKSVLSPDSYEGFLARDKISRKSAYTGSSRLPLSAQIRLVEQTRRDFKHPRWHSAFGGPSWAAAARQTAWLGHSITSFCEKPDTRRWLRLQCRYNATLHACHNNGKVLTKWIIDKALNAGATAPTLCFMNPFAAEVVLHAPDSLPSLTDLQQALKEEFDHGK